MSNLAGFLPNLRGLAAIIYVLLINDWQHVLNHYFLINHLQNLTLMKKLFLILLIAPSLCMPIFTAAQDTVSVHTVKLSTAGTLFKIDDKVVPVEVYRKYENEQKVFMQNVRVINRVGLIFCAVINLLRKVFFVK